MGQTNGHCAAAILLLAVAVALAGGARGQLALPPGEISKAITDLDGTEEAGRVVAAEKLSAAGQSAMGALPALIRMAADKKSANCRTSACKALAAIAPDSKEAADAAYQSFACQDKRSAAIRARKGSGAWLAMFLPGLVLPYLRKDLRCDDEDYLVEVLSVLKAMGEKAQAAGGDILKALGTAKLGLTRRIAVEALAACAPGAPEVLGQLADAARSDPKPLVRQACLDVIVNSNTPVAKVVEILCRALGDSDERVRYAAAYALSRLKGSDTAPVVQAARADDPAQRAAALRAIGLAGDPPEGGRKALVAALDDKDPAVRAAAAQALAWLGGPEAANAEEAILALLKTDDSWVRAAAASALRHGGDKARVALIAALSDDDYKVRREAKASLAYKGKDAIEAVVALLASNSAALRWQGIEILTAMGSGAQSALPQLLAALADDTWYVRREAVRALGALAAKDTAVVAKFRERVEQDSDWTVRIEAYHWLESWNAEGKLSVKPY